MVNLYILIDKNSKRVYYSGNSRKMVRDFQKSSDQYKHLQIVKLTGNFAEEKIMTAQNTVTLTEALFNQITAYLGNRPYVEVAGIVDALRKELTAAATTAASSAAHAAVSAAGSNGAGAVSEEERDLSASA